eukprot:scaffold323509_cov27-Prasinocladus_malaysianus.AAC.1
MTPPAHTPTPTHTRCLLTTHPGFSPAEQSCTLTLTGCRPGLCYSFQEVSELLAPMDPVYYRVCNEGECVLLGNGTDQPPAVYGAFSSIKAVLGASKSIHS